MASSIRCSFDVKGIEEKLKVLKRLGADIDKIATEAVEKSAEPIVEDIRPWAEKHKRTGAAVAGVIEPKAKNSAGYISAEVGIKSTAQHPDAWHIVFVEYGTPRAPADPAIRPAFKKNRVKVKRIQKEILNKEIEKRGGGRPFD